MVLLHGFTQTMESWRLVADDLASDHRVVVVDAPGHGGSSPVRADLWDAARLVGEVGGRAVYVGYSMGGRIALRLALDRPDLVEGLVLIGATAGIDDAEDRAARRRADRSLADHIESVGVDVFLEEWLAQPLFAGLPENPTERAARSTNQPTGLAASLRDAGTGTMDPPWWNDLKSIEAPVTTMAGDLDRKFTTLARRLAAAVPDGEVRVVQSAGHAVGLHDPAAVAAAVRDLRRRITIGGGGGRRPDRSADQADTARPRANRLPKIT